MQAYLLFTAPAIFIITAVFFRYLNFIKPRFKKAKLVISLIAILLLLLPVRYAIERIKPFSSRERNPQWVADLKSLNEIFQEEKVVVFNLKRPIEAMFYCDNIIAYSVVPDEKMLAKVMKKGYSSFIVKENGEIKLLKKATKVVSEQLFYNKSISCFVELRIDDFLNIEFGNIFSNDEIEVFIFNTNSVVKFYKRITEDNIQIDVSDYINGLYFIKVISSGNQGYASFVVSH